MHTIESGAHVRHPRRTTPFAFPTITPMEGAGFFSLGGNSDRGYAASWIWTSENAPSRTFVNKATRALVNKGKKEGRGC
jgi:hypothetical protein